MLLYSPERQFAPNFDDLTSVNECESVLKTDGRENSNFLLHDFENNKDFAANALVDFYLFTRAIGFSRMFSLKKRQRELALMCRLQV